MKNTMKNKRESHFNSSVRSKTEKQQYEMDFDKEKN